MKIVFFSFAVFAAVSCVSQSANKQIKTYYNSGKVKSITEMFNGKKNGLEQLFFENGNLFMIQHYKNDMPVDSFYQYDKDSANVVLFKGYCFPRVHAIIYYSNGDVYGETDFKEKSVEDGMVTLYFTNGNVAATTIYKNGKKNGTYIDYYLNGKTRRIIHYKDGLEIPPVIQFDTTGELINHTR